VYALDLLGFGSSEKPIIDYSMELWDQQIRDFMQEFIDVSSPAIIMGNSVGSLASLMVAAQIPERIRGVVLFNCAGGMNNKAISDDWRIKLAMPIFLLIDWILNRPTLARRLFDNVRQPANLKQILEGVYPRNPSAVDDELVEMLHGPSNDPGALETFVNVITGPPGKNYF
jgi:pimeloyl-ACP methyl ester carboxylesterase